MKKFRSEQKARKVNREFLYNKFMNADMKHHIHAHVQGMQDCIVSGLRQLGITKRWFVYIYSEITAFVSLEIMLLMTQMQFVSNTSTIHLQWLNHSLEEGGWGENLEWRSVSIAVYCHQVGAKLSFVGLIATKGQCQ